MVISKFALGRWYFKNHKCLEIEKKLTYQDAEVFKIEKALEHSVKNKTQYFRECQQGIERYIFNIEINVEKNLKKLQR